MEKTTVGTVSNVPIHTRTAAGAAYVRKACHPPSPLDSTYEGRPDCSAPNVVLMELKSEANFAPILTLATSSTVTKTVNPSSMLFLQPPGAYVGNFVFMLSNEWTGPISTGWVQPINSPGTANVRPTINQFNPPANLLNGYNFDNWTTDITRHRVAYKSSTYYLNSTDFNNQGTVTTAKVRPNVNYSSTVGTLMKEYQDDPIATKNLKNCLKGMLDNYNATNKSNEKLRYSDDGYDVVDSVGTVINNFTFQILEFGPSSGVIDTNQNLQGVMSMTTCFPTTASELLVQSPKSVTRPAKEGAFVVLQQAEPTLSWIDVQDNTIAAQQQSDQIPTGLPTTLMRVRVRNGNSWTYQFGYLFSDRIIESTAPAKDSTDTIWDGLDWSLTLFEGLTVPSSTGTTLSSVPYVTVKTIVGLEIVPQLKSSLQCFSRTLPMPDQDAIDMVVGIMHARPDSLPASANDLGSIAKVAIRYLPDAIDWLKNLFGSKKETPKAVEVVRPPAKNKATKSKPLAAKKSQPDRSSVDRKVLNELNSKIDKLALSMKRTPTLPSYRNSTAFSGRKTTKKVMKASRR